ncbi:MAG: DHH family phosphoesterase [Thaumarchaeota archaeon]|jgi:RecJ-like exonuclease|nr:DHH family phosphoesterase [Candidatus Terraquivivens yellowstonensis]MCL7399572.1 DHH family phosphoesterase [Candidatus Terraquivivens yellowstonensis]
MNDAYERLLSSAAKAAEFIEECVEQDALLLLVCHNDADALSSCGIMVGSLWRSDARFLARSVNRIDEFFQQLDEGSADADCIVFLDLGSGYVKEIYNKIGEKKVVIIDHHQPQSFDIPKCYAHLNPHLQGLDGATHISASGLAYLVSKALNEENYIYSPIAVVGALGDLQDKDDKRRLGGVNAKIVEEAVEKGLMQVTEDLILFGRSFRPIHAALASTSSPFLPGLTGREDVCYSLVTSLGIKVKDGDRWRVLADLTDEEKSKLYNGIISFLASKGLVAGNIAKELIGVIYELTEEDRWTYLRDAREFAWLLNACGKTGNAWMGIAIAAGVRGSILEEAQKLLEDYRAQMAKNIELFTRPGSVTNMEHIVVFNGGDLIDDRQVSSLASLISSSGMIPQDKVLIAWAKHGDRVKVSARANRSQVEKGINLGSILSDVANAVGGRGGGHNIAAGADLPAEMLEQFLKEVDKRVGSQLGA